MNKSPILIVAALALAGGIALSWLVASQREITLESATWFGDQARPLPAFELTDHRGEALTPASLEGHWSLLFFGFTHCPHICPTTMLTLSEMTTALDDPDVAGALSVYFVSVDPARDTTERLATYVANFNPSFTGATATDEQLRPLISTLGVAKEVRSEGEGTMNYQVDHGSAVVLINPRAEYAGVFGAPHEALAMARDMTRIIEHWN